MPFAHMLVTVAEGILVKKPDTHHRALQEGLMECENKELLSIQNL